MLALRQDCPQVVSLFVLLTAKQNIRKTEINKKAEESGSLNTQLAVLGGGLAGEGMFYPSVGKRARVFA